MADSVVNRVLGWLRGGYPQGIPQNDYIALFGILHRTLTRDEVEQIAHETYRARVGRDGTDEEIRERIRTLIHEEPTEADVRRVAARLAAGGWPLGVPTGGDEQNGSEPKG